MENKKTIKRAYKVELKVNKNIHGFFVLNAAISRVAWNWGLEQYDKYYPIYLETKKNFDFGAMSKQWTKTRPELFPWMAAGIASAGFRALDKLKEAFIGENGFYKKLKTGKVSEMAKNKRRHKKRNDANQSTEENKNPHEIPGYPKFKSKFRNNQSFSFQGAKTDGTQIKIPKIGWIKFKERGYMPTIIDEHRVVTISQKANRWFVSISVDEEIDPQVPGNEKVGIFLGISTLATCSNGKDFLHSKPLVNNLKKLKRLSRQLSRKKLGSYRRELARLRIAKLHARIANQRKDLLHKATTQIIKKDKPGVVVLKDLNIKGMMKNNYIARPISDVGMFEFKRQIEYKSEQVGTEVVIAEKEYSTVKTCCLCGFYCKDFLLRNKEFICPNCNSVLYREQNGAIRLLQYGGSRRDSSSLEGI